MSADPDRTPKRLSTRQLRGLDLSVADVRLVWATDASASSEWSSDYAASAACGPPDVFPRMGDHKGTWLSSSDDTAPWLEVTFPTVSEAAALIVCETCGPGSVVSVRDLDRGDELLREDQAVPRSKKGAQLLVIPLDPIAAPPRRVRLTLSGHKSDYQEIDAVGIITVALDTLIAEPPAPPPVTHRRYAPKDVPLHDLRGDRRLVWAMRARASSTYSSSYEAKEAVGRPNVFPKGGDQYKTWLSDNSDRNAWLELDFAPTDPCHGFVALEICGAGCIVRATDADGTLLWSAKPEQVPSREARLLHVPFDPPRHLTKLRLWVSPTIDDYREIDAVALLSAPFGELATIAPAPPLPPPPPVPGEPAGGFTQLTGVLQGPTPERPLLHLTLHTSKGRVPMNRADDVRLQLDTGREVTLEIDRTTVYGRPVLRREERFGELAEELPWLREALGTNAPADDEEVVLEGEQLLGGERVHVAGRASGPGRMGGFREAAEPYERLVAAAIASRPLSATPFPKKFTGALESACRSSETFTAHSEYLGTTQRVDDQGRVTTHDDYRNWQTRSVSSSVAQRTGVYLADGTLMRAGEVKQTVDVSLTPRASKDPVYASFASEHAPGDVASLFGVAREEDGGFVVDPCRVLLGDITALRRETVRHLGALLGLLLLVAAGVAGAVTLATRVVSV